MNIYTSPTGCFKAHVDTPRGDTMFGTLVVCMPSRFEGGALVTRHGGQEITYNWSALSGDSTPQIQWAAVYGDVEHEILPVTHGHRVTLAYNLYYWRQEPSVVLDVTTSLFYSNLKTALSSPYYLRQGGDPGVCLSTFVKLNESPKDIPILPKGSDRTVVLAVKLLGLRVQVKPEYDLHNTYESHEFNEIGWGLDWDDRENDKFYIDESVQFRSDWSDGGVINWHKYQKERTKDIIWCQDITWQPALIAPHYGNEATVGILYQAAAILVFVPPWNERRQSLMNEDA